ncbi:lipopolysaccharide biosynthesis protein [Streptococcus pacificus]|uniref:Lipopolysaccharide biosynthesis protein n=1 Tax=Streptococcus pacificus TaxID=2740577 RepID=A0ABS0ZH50_9STRE|nr:lipopolysaccharide biosynthesis protein [Streptococcus pacificus]MBJ8325328.1 lipopolysaccharide biosynthesis protein [Streptococcus pacificus]
MNKLTSYQKMFFWNMMGSLSTAVISVVLLIVVSRFLNTIDSDSYVFAYSLGNLFVVIGLFQIRNFQATDIEEKYSFSIYFLARLFSCLLMITITIIYLMLTNYDIYKSQVIFYVSLYRLSDALSDLFQGLFQQHERLDIAGKSLTFRNSLIFLIFAILIFMTRDLLFSLQMLCITSFIFIALYDIRKSIRFDKVDFIGLLSKNSFVKCLKLMNETLPLFINGFLIIFIYNQPKFSLETMTNLGKIAFGSQTIFNILFMPAFVMNLMMLFFRPVITEMAIAIAKQKNHQFKILQRKLFSNLFFLSILIIFGSGIVGIKFLEILYNIELKEYWFSLIVIMIGGSIGSFATAIDNILTAMRFQKYLIIPYSGSFIVSLLFSNKLVENFQIFGASLSFITAMVVWLTLSIVVFQFVKRRSNGHF